MNTPLGHAPCHAEYKRKNLDCWEGRIVTRAVPARTQRSEDKCCLFCNYSFFLSSLNPGPPRPPLAVEFPSNPLSLFLEPPGGRGRPQTQGGIKRILFFSLLILWIGQVVTTCWLTLGAGGGMRPHPAAGLQGPCEPCSTGPWQPWTFANRSPADLQPWQPWAPWPSASIHETAGYLCRNVIFIL